jgi:hypothetical protein
VQALLSVRITELCKTCCRRAGVGRQLRIWEKFNSELPLENQSKVSWIRDSLVSSAVGFFLCGSDSGVCAG